LVKARAEVYVAEFHALAAIHHAESTAWHEHACTYTAT
jgi:hypothetical protein